MFSTYLALTVLPLTLVHGLTISNWTETVTSTGPISISWPTSSDPYRGLAEMGTPLSSRISPISMISTLKRVLSPSPRLSAPLPQRRRWGLSTSGSGSASVSGSTTHASSASASALDSFTRTSSATPSTSSAASTASSAFNAASRAQVGGAGILVAI
ncbi:hypothetical protein ARMGADRAFT_1031170 [Armillaria gallica]|uniref:Uncharacterized protein n=1 Tax=Armillaria gallica TaxID=47427 RepID=A0A2H3DAM7_ARMGA|nr:hypothetical protein ARMGADRAFT_1031170 [Armillaria gallica]